jgi:cysteine desulfurase/selenocysteine lyase
VKLDIRWIRDEFPICRQKFPIPGHAAPQPIRYFDHGASTHPPRAVLEAHREFLEKYYANIHRGHHNLSMIASDLFDRVADTVAAYIGADLTKQTIFLTYNTTAALDICSSRLILDSWSSTIRMLALRMSEFMVFMLVSLWLRGLIQFAKI